MGDRALVKNIQVLDSLKDIKNKSTIYTLFRMCTHCDDIGCITGSPVELAKKYKLGVTMFEIAVCELKKLDLLRKVKNKTYMISPLLLLKDEKKQLNRATSVWYNNTTRGRRNMVKSI